MKVIILSVAVILSSVELRSQVIEDSLVKLTKVYNSYPYPSKDDKLIAYHSNYEGNNDIYIKNLVTSQVKKLTYHPENDRTPSISPDGKKIAFVSTRDGNYDVFLMNIDGTDQTNLTNDPESKDIHPYWSPDGKWIIFNSTNKGEDYDLYIMSPDGMDRKKIRKDRGEATHAQYSPDGTKIVFRRFYVDDSKNYNSEIMLLDLMTGKETRITTFKGSDEHPTWSPDGESIVFVSNREYSNSSSLFQYNFNSRTISQITMPTEYQTDMTPVYSTSGDSIFFCRMEEGGAIEIYQLFLK